MDGHRLAEGGVGARGHEQVEVGSRELDPAAGLDPARQASVEVCQPGHEAPPRSVAVACSRWRLDFVIGGERAGPLLQGSHISFSPPFRFPISSIPSDFGAAVRRERRALGWTQARLATRAGLDRATVVRLEAGRRRPTGDTVFRLESALDVLPGTLVPAWPEWSPIGTTEPGAKSRERRRSLGLTLDQVAASAGVSAATLSRFERDARVPSLTFIETSELGGEWRYVRSAALAAALRFASLEDHAAYCSRV